MFDTGAYLSVVNRETAVAFGFHELPPIEKNVPVGGFAGSREVNLVEIPGIVLGGRRLINVRVAIPNGNTNDNILGLNVLEHFNYLVDTKNSLIYFSENDNYRLPPELDCRQILSLDSLNLRNQ